MLLKLLLRTFRTRNVRPLFYQGNYIHNSSCLLYNRKPHSKFPVTGITKKYEVFDESKIEIIGHTDEEISTTKEKILNEQEQYDDIKLIRGETGVFEIEDLVKVLQRENCKDIFVATVPKELHYVNFICIVSGRSKRHLAAIAEFVKKIYKMKCSKSDLVPKIEGKASDEWLALDLGNIALHIFSEKAREVYDLETLWSVGPKYDDKTNEKDDNIVELLQSHSTFLKDFKPRS